MADITPVHGLKLDLPEILNLPSKILPILTEFNRVRYFLLVGGRGSAKSHSIGRFLLYLGEQRKLRIVCGREIQANIEESVFTLLVDLISQYNLAYDVYRTKGSERLVHRVTGTEIKFKGFREQGSVSIKGLEGVDILWIDESQSITKTTLDIIIPTIRKDKAKVFFTMNRFMRDDAVPEFLVGRSDCLHIEINYFENPFCPLNLKVEAENMRNKSIRDYNHIWLGQPLSSADDYLFNYDKLHKAINLAVFGENVPRQRILSIDIAAQGNDQCVATVFDRVTNQHWKPTERMPWDEPDTMVSVGRIVGLVGTHKPDITVLDIGGLGKPVYDRLHEVGIKNLYAYNGGSTEGVDIRHHANIRAAAYCLTKDWFDNEFLSIDPKDIEFIKQLEKIRFKYRSNGSKIIQAKVDMKKELGYSPDDADSLVMAIWAAANYLGKQSNNVSGGGQVRRVSASKRGRK